MKLRQAKSEAGYLPPDTAANNTVLNDHELRSTWEGDNLAPDNIMLWAACCTCFFGFLRSGEIMVPSLKEYDPEGHLSVGDVALDRFGGQGSHKTVQDCRRGVWIYSGRTENDLCLVAALCLSSGAWL